MEQLSKLDPTTFFYTKVGKTLVIGQRRGGKGIVDYYKNHLHRVPLGELEKDASLEWTQLEKWSRDWISVSPCPLARCPHAGHNLCSVPGGLPDRGEGVCKAMGLAYVPLEVLWLGPSLSPQFSQEEFTALEGEAKNITCSCKS